MQNYQYRTTTTPTNPITRRDYNKLALYVIRAYKNLNTKALLKNMPILVQDACSAYRLPSPSNYQTKKILALATRLERKKTR